LASAGAVTTPISPFVIQVASWNQGIFTLSGPSQTNRTYSLQCKQSFAASAWTEVSSTLGNGGTISLVDSGATNSHRVYRVKAF
jgi:hypothetical protein